MGRNTTIKDATIWSGPQSMVPSNNLEWSAPPPTNPFDSFINVTPFLSLTTTTSVCGPLRFLNIFRYFSRVYDFWYTNRRETASLIRLLEEGVLKTRRKFMHFGWTIAPSSSSSHLAGWLVGPCQRYIMVWTVERLIISPGQLCSNTPAPIRYYVLYKMEGRVERT